MLAEVVTALQAVRAIDLIAAVTMLAEIGELSRFRNPRELLGFLRLVPSEHSTGRLSSVAVLPRPTKGHGMRGPHRMRN